MLYLSAGLSVPENLHIVIDRLTSLGIYAGSVLADLTEDELNAVWAQQHGDHLGWSGPGTGRVLLKEVYFRIKALIRTDQPGKTLPLADDALAKSLALLAKANTSKVKKSGPRDMDYSDQSNDEEDFDLGHALKNQLDLRGGASRIPVSWFADPQRLAKLQRFASKLGLKRSFVATSPIEDWAPGWVGHLKTSSERKSLLASRKSSFDRTSVPVFLSNTLSFWLSHMAIGKVQMSSVLAHTCLLLRMVEEHSLLFAQKYESALLTLLVDLQKSGDLTGLDDRLCTEDDKIVQRLRLDSSRPQFALADRERPRREPRLKAIEDQAPGPRNPRRGVLPTGQAIFPSKGKGKGREKGDRRRDAATPPDGGRRPPMCLDHAVHLNIKCTQRGCAKEHLDTAVPALKERYERALNAFKAVEARRSSGTRGGSAR